MLKLRYRFKLSSFLIVAAQLAVGLILASVAQAEPALNNGFKLGWSAPSGSLFELKVGTQSPQPNPLLPDLKKIYIDSQKLQQPVPLQDLLKSTVGGDWESSGGSGMICFSNEAAAQAYEKTQKAGLAIGEELAAQVETVETLDFWEADQAEGYMSGPDYRVILQKVQRNLRRHSSLLAYRYTQMSRKISLEKWSGVQKLDRVMDYRIRRTLTTAERSRCRVGQLAVRYTQKTKVELMPPVLVLFDELLWNKMNALNRAMLILHEQTYYFARTGDDQNADRSRDVVRHLVNENFWNSFAGDDKKMATALSQLFEHDFGDYHRKFFAQENPARNVKPYTQASRYQSFKSLLEKMSLALQNCVQASGNVSGCRQKLLSMKPLLASLSEEETFVFVARFMLVPTMPDLHLADSEKLYVDWSDARFQSEAADALGTYCSYVQDLKAKATGLIASSAGYCAKLR